MALPFFISQPFTISAMYADDAAAYGLPSGARAQIGVFRIEGIPEDVAAAALADPTKKPQVRVEVSLDSSGVFHVTKAVLMKEIKDEVPAGAGAAAPAAPEGDDAAAPTSPIAADAAGAAEPPKKKRYQRVALTVTVLSSNGMTHAAIEAAVAQELAITKQDTAIRETHDKRNELEAYIYGMRNNLTDSLAAYATETDKAALAAKLGEVEDWLYNGEGFDTTKDVYQMRLDSLKALGEPIVRREWEHTHRGDQVANINRDIEAFKKIANSSVRIMLVALREAAPCVSLEAAVLCGAVAVVAPSLPVPFGFAVQTAHGAALSFPSCRVSCVQDALYEHLTDEDRGKVKGSCRETEEWIAAQLERQGKLSLTDDPVVRVADIEQARRVCFPL
jgi:hypothetical protein